MKTQVHSLLLSLLLLLPCFDGTVEADGNVDCESCFYNDYGTGYMHGDFCNQFYKCQRLPGGYIKSVLLCCPDGLIWDDYFLTCTHGVCADGYMVDNCPVTLDPTGNDCRLLPHQDAEMFYMIYDTTISEMHCAPGTMYDHANCTCVHGGQSGCDADPMLYFPFATHDNDIQCQHAEGISHGDAHVDTDIGALCLNEHGSFVEVPFLANWFADRPDRSFTVSLWFTQDDMSFVAESSQGLFSNSDCDHPPTLFIGTDNGIVVGYMSTPTDDVWFYNDDAAQREYLPNEWHHIAMRYDPGVVTYFLDGIVVGEQPIEGPVYNSHGPATIGVVYFSGYLFHFKGCIDDVMVFDRYVSDDEMLTHVFGRQRTTGTSEAAYDVI